MKIKHPMADYKNLEQTVSIMQLNRDGNILSFYLELVACSKVLVKRTCGPGPIPMPCGILSWIGCMPDRPCGLWFKVCSTET